MEISVEWYPVIAVVVLWVAGQLLAYIARRNPELENEYDLLTWASVLVGAAEQLYESNDAKFKYVMSHLQERFPEVTAADLRNALEWAVHQMGMEEPKPQPPAPPAADDTATINVNWNS